VTGEREREGGEERKKGEEDERVGRTVMPRRALVSLAPLCPTVARRRLPRAPLGCHHRWRRAVHQWHHQAWRPTVGLIYGVSFSRCLCVKIVS
jgi:hypothetical protein